ncbi:hypothetical protein [Paraconexibacter algicola]|uniref:Uncharacterized protein n=1 Tax=Paraconexibacter algicola TaxID=2133960 RepID=A0A2T4UF43_9ACTN|nr:hypothetical protein [Paraconexibacter algicola]PTL56400.1 hypothetical protein C7Y72_15670 [Paraconexibacter algicola]
MTLPIAHAGHWLVSLLYLAPVVILVGALMVARARDEGFEDDDDPVFADGAFDDDLSPRAPR